MGTRTGARTPEELDALVEDAFVLRDGAQLCDLFAEGAVLAAAGHRSEARGARAIGCTAAALWACDRTYVGGAVRVLEARGTALVIAASAIHVARRDRDGTWRLVISLLHVGQPLRGARMTQDTQQLHAALTRHGEGEARWWFSALAEIKVTAEQSGGRLSVLEVTEPPNTEAPLHVHHRDDESFWIIEGDVTFEVGGTTVPAGAGDFVFAPHAVPHRYTVGNDGCRMLFIMTPGGFEQLVRDTSVPARARTLPPPATDEPDWEHIAAAATAGGCELLQ